MNKEIKIKDKTFPKKGKNSRKPIRKYPNKGVNDLSWYNNYSTLAAGMVGANFIRRKGIAERVSNATSFKIPSVMGIQYTPTVGSTQGEGYLTSVNKLYASLRSANTGSPAYTKLDLQGYLLNLRTILIELRHLRRAYGVIKKFDLADKTLPVSLFKAMGLDYDTFAANAADLRNVLNYLSVQLHTLMPFKSDLFERTIWMEDHIFKDSNDAKAQLYLFTPHPIVPTYDYSSGTIVETTSTTSIVNYANQSSVTGQTYINAINNIRAHVNAILSSDKVAIIAADILKAYGTSTIKYFEEIPENYTVDYVYSEEVLTQIQNARSIGGSRSTTATQDSRVSTAVVNSNLVSEAHFAFGPRYADDSYINATKAFINMYKDNISNLDLIGATRLTFTAHADTAVTNRFILDSFGTEVVNEFMFVTDKPVGDTSTYAYDMFISAWSTWNTLSFAGSNAAAQSCKLIALWATFDWAPALYMNNVSYYNNTGSLDNTGYGAFPVWDFNNYALVEPQQIDSYHDIAILSLNYCDSLVRNVNLIPVK